MIFNGIVLNYNIFDDYFGQHSFKSDFSCYIVSFQTTI